MMDNLMSATIGGVAGAVIGAIITGWFTIRAVRQTHQNDLEKQEINEEQLIKSILQALYDEIDTLWNMYNNRVGIKLEALPEKTIFHLIYPVTQEYFTVYNGNSFLIGRIKDHDLRKAIITTYTRAKGLLDSFRMNNDLLQKFDYFYLLHQETGNSVHEQARNIQHLLLIDYAEKLKVSHNELKQEVHNLLRMFNKQGVISEK